jgi:hypothetical protein
MRPISAKKRFGIATFSDFELGNAQGLFRDAATPQANFFPTPIAVSFLNRVWQLFIYCFMTKQRSRRRIQLSRSLNVVGVSTSL